ncbi:MAG: crossover junction endodeoxyribonuclease RuvC [Rhodobacteraceae bacterium]|nr:crossover junction endodeoxyribonuclease RuvC [Paracoccaceae bacterium]
MSFVPQQVTRPVIMGIDPSYHGLGWAVGCGDWEKPAFGTIRGSDLPHKEGQHFAKVRDTLTRLVRNHGVLHIAIEEPIHNPRDTNPARELAIVGTVAVVLMVAADFEIGASYVSIAEWRKRFINRSYSPPEVRVLGADRARKWLKDRAELECKKRGWPVTCHDEADACGVMHLALSIHDKNYARGDAPIFRKRG